eukprot:2398800-Amphidinium_carterae.1
MTFHLGQVSELTYDLSLYKVVELTCNAPGTKDWKGPEHTSFVLRGKGPKSTSLLEWSVGQ